MPGPSGHCCIHIGLPKTATTTLQFSLFSQHSQIEYLGKPYYVEAFGYEKSKACADLVDSIWRKDSLQFCGETAKDLYLKGIEPRKSSGKMLVLSEEGLTYAGGADRYLIATRLKEIFGSCKILITIRDQISSLKSLYVWYYTRGLIDNSFDAWVNSMFLYSPFRQHPDDFPLRQYRYHELLPLYGDLFGNTNLCVLPYEMLADDPQDFARELSTFLAIDSAESWRLLSREKHNVSPSSLGVAYQRSVKKVKRWMAHVSGNDDFVPSEGLEEGMVHDRIMRCLNHLPKMQVKMSHATRQRLCDYYSSGNTELQKRYDLMLDRYGYP